MNITPVAYKYLEHCGVLQGIDEGLAVSMCLVLEKLSSEYATYMFSYDVVRNLCLSADMQESLVYRLFKAVDYKVLERETELEFVRKTSIADVSLLKAPLAMYTFSFLATRALGDGVNGMRARETAEILARAAKREEQSFVDWRTWRH